MCSTRRPSDNVGGPFLFLVLTISPPLRFGPALCPAVEEALGRRVGTLTRRLSKDSSADTPSSSAASSVSLNGISWRMRSKLFLPSRRAPSSNPLACARHTVRTLIEEVISAVAVAEIVELPHFIGGDSRTHFVLIDGYFDGAQIPAEVACARMRFHQFRRPDLCVPLCGRIRPRPPIRGRRGFLVQTPSSTRKS